MGATDELIRFRTGGIAGLGGTTFVPSYTLPSVAGDVVHVSPSSVTFNSIRPGGISAADWTAVNAAYGWGIWVPTYDLYGGYFVGGGNGGHDDGMNYYGAVWPVNTGEWKLLTPTNTIDRYVAFGVSQNHTTAETNGTPYYSVSGTTPTDSVPAGAHAYRNQVGYDDSSRYGSVYWIHRGAATRTSVNPRTAHKIALGDTGLTYSQVASCPTDRGGADDCIVVIGSTAYRITSDNHNFTSLETFNFLTAAYGLTSTYTSPSSSCSGNGAAWKHLDRYIIKIGATSTLWIFDTQIPATGWVQLTTSGTFPTATSLTQVPAKHGNNEYWVPRAGGTSLTKLTPPENMYGGTWAFGTATVSSSIPAHSTGNDMYNTTFAVTIGGTQMIGHCIGGDYGMHLLIPGS